MNKEMANLIHEWQETGNSYRQALKRGLLTVARELFEKMREYARKLHELRFPLGLPPTEARYVAESLKAIKSNPTSQMSRAVILEIPEILNRFLAPQISRAIAGSDKPKYTMVNFELFELNADGSLSFPPKKPQPETPQIPKETIFKRNIAFHISPHPPFPEICDKTCPYTQCSTWGNPQAIGKPCRNLTLTNEELKKEGENNNV